MKTNELHRPEVVVITGASAGVGRATARAFAQRGAAIALLARGVEGLEGARHELEALGARALVLPTDVADAAQVEAAAEQIERELGPIDVWVNNAMTSVFAPVRETTAEEFRRVTEVTYLGYVHGTLAALRRMLLRDRGTIVQVGSALAYRSIPLQAAYCAAKHAIKGFTEALRTELLHDKSNIRVTQVHLPAMNTPQFGWSRARMARSPPPIPPIFQPEVAAEAIVHAAHHVRREWWVSWPTIKAILGERLAPGLADRYLARRGFDAQQTDRALPRDRVDNLFAPVPGDHGAHGSFDDCARDRSLQAWADRNRAALTLGALALGATASALVPLVHPRVRAFWRA